MDRKTSFLYAASGVTYLGTVFATFKYGNAMKHPIAGLLVGMFVTGPAAGAIVGNLGRAILGPSSVVLPANGNPSDVPATGPTGINRGAMN